MRIVFFVGLGCCCGSFLAFCQQTTDPPVQPGTIVKRSQPEPESKRVLGVIPNYRTSPSLTQYQPLTPGEKFVIASQDSFDRGTVVLAAAFAGQAQLTNSNRSFGQGAA